MKTTNRKRLKAALVLLVALALSTVVAQSVLAGPQNVPRAADVEHARRLVEPALGSDERTQLPRGSWIAGNGVVEPREPETRVAAEVGGRIARIAVAEGQFVEAGELLLELHGGSEQASVLAAQAELDVASAELSRTTRGLRREELEAVTADTESLQARAELSRAIRERMVTLAKSGAATPDELERAARQAESDQKALDAAEARRRAAVAGSRAEDIAIARARREAASARLEDARARLERLSIRAPIAGEVLQVKYRAGEYYAPGAEPLVVLGDTRSLRVRVDVDERDVLKLERGAAASVTLNAAPGRRFAGTLVEVGRRMGRKNVRTDDPVERIDTKILEVVVELAEKDALVPGMRVVAYLAQ